MIGVVEKLRWEFWFEIRIGICVRVSEGVGDRCRKWGLMEEVEECVVFLGRLGLDVYLVKLRVWLEWIIYGGYIVIYLLCFSIVFVFFIFGMNLLLNFWVDFLF